MDGDPSPAAVDLPLDVLDSIADLVVVFDDTGELSGWNDSLADATGYTDEALSSLSTDDLFDDAARVRDTVTAVAGGESTTFDSTLFTVDGDRLDYEFNAAEHVDSDADERHVVCIGRDVTDVRRGGCERYETLLESLADAVYAIEPDGTIAYVNEQYARMKGVSRAELVGTDLDEWVTDETVERAEHRRAELAAGERDVATIEYEFVTGDGERFPAELRFGNVADGESDVYRVGMIRDVTARVERERTLERKNEQLDEFAAIVSHDLRNPLNVAEGRLELAQAECDSDHLTAVEDAHERMRRLIDDLLTLARQGRTETESTSVSLARLADQCWDAVDEETRTLRVETDATVHADEGQLRRLLENLFRNSVEHGSTSSRSKTGDSVEHGSTRGRPGADDAVEHGSTASPSHGRADGAERGSTDDRRAAGEGAERGAESVTVTVGDLPSDEGFFVADDGPGIPGDERERVFDSGYSTSPDGTGFGLRIVRAIAAAHGWEVSVTESADGGARFEVRGATGE